MGFNCGIIGLPNVGKSTIFNALTDAGAAASSYAFSTVKPNIAMISVPDERLTRIAEIVRPDKVVSTQMEFVDIPGIQEGSSKGEGLGNRFLGHVRMVDAMAHIVRCFESSEVAHVSEKLDPVSDIETVESELMLADLESIERKLASMKKLAKGGSKDDLALIESLEKISDGLQKGVPALKTGGLELAAELPLLTAKKVMLVANMADPSQVDSPIVKSVRDCAAERGAAFASICGRLEAEIGELDPEERPDFIKELGLESSGLDLFINEGYKLLELITFFTAGPKEARAWTIHQGTTAQMAAGKIHTDFIKGFIRAEVIAYDDYMECGGEAGAKEKGKMRLEGKEYIVKNGDVILFRINA